MPNLFFTTFSTLHLLRLVTRKLKMFWRKTSSFHQNIFKLAASNFFLSFFLLFLHYLYFRCFCACCIFHSVIVNVTNFVHASMANPVLIIHKKHSDKTKRNCLIFHNIWNQISVWSKNIVSVYGMSSDIFSTNDGCSKWTFSKVQRCFGCFKRCGAKGEGVLTIVWGGKSKLKTGAPKHLVLENENLTIRLQVMRKNLKVRRDCEVLQIVQFFWSIQLIRILLKIQRLQKNKFSGFFFFSLLALQEM